MRIRVIDLETTGLEPTDHVVEIAAWDLIPQQMRQWPNYLRLEPTRCSCESRISSPSAVLVTPELEGPLLVTHPQEQGSALTQQP